MKTITREEIDMRLPSGAARDVGKIRGSAGGWRAESRYTANSKDLGIDKDHICAETGAFVMGLKKKYRVGGAIRH